MAVRWQLMLHLIFSGERTFLELSQILCSYPNKKLVYGMPYTLSWLAGPVLAIEMKQLWMNQRSFG